MPHQGSPFPSDNPRLQGLRWWPVPRFPRFAIFYFPRDDEIEIIRVLHVALVVTDTVGVVVPTLPELHAANRSRRKITFGRSLGDVPASGVMDRAVIAKGRTRQRRLSWAAGAVNASSESPNANGKSPGTTPVYLRAVARPPTSALAAALQFRQLSELRSGFLEQGARQCSEAFSQASVIYRPALIDHDFTIASIAGDAPREFDP